MEAFTTEGVAKDMNVSVPAALLKLHFGDIEVQPGDVMTPTQVQNPPSCEWDHEPGGLYTIIMNDPDAPRRSDPKFREWHHWCVANIPGTDTSKGDTLTEYIGSGPPKETGLHRYVFLVYKQVGKINFNEPKLKNTSTQGRASHHASAMAKKYKFGSPVAGNFYQAEWDDYVEKLYEQFK